MITAIASCPSPPLLLPGATGGTVAEVEELRSACLRAVRTMLTGGATTVVVIGTGQNREEPPDELSLQVGQVLLSEAGVSDSTEIALQPLPADLPPQDCLLLGRELAADERTLALLVMADGSARRSEKAPGYFDPRAEPFDDQIQAALSNVDLEALAELDPQLATDLLVAGRPAWQVMAAAAAAGGPGALWQATPQYFGAPFGVFYPVVNWMPA